MGYYSTNEFRSGLKIIIDGEPCSIIENEFVKPGKGQSFSRVRIRKLISGKILEKTFKSSDSLESANVIDINLTYLYNDRKFWYFINKENFEQISADIKVIGETSKWLYKESECMLTLWNDYPITVTPPNFVELKVLETDPGIKGDTASTGGKLAKLITGAIIKVPLFIQIGEVIRVDTRSSEYVSRVK